MIGSKEYYEKIQLEIESQIIKACEGEINHLDALIELENHKAKMNKSLELIQEFKDEFISEIESESLEHNKIYNGYKIQVQGGSKIFNFKGIKEVQEKEEELKAIKEKAKQAFLSKEKGMLNVDENGEEVELPTISYKKSFVTIKKEG